MDFYLKIHHTKFDFIVTVIATPGLSFFDILQMGVKYD